MHTIPIGTTFTILGLTYTVINVNYCDTRSYLVRTPTGATTYMNLGE